jgi:hypothetical protein
MSNTSSHSKVSSSTCSKLSAEKMLTTCTAEAAGQYSPSRFAAHSPCSAAGFPYLGDWAPGGGHPAQVGPPPCRRAQDGPSRSAQRNAARGTAARAAVPSVSCAYADASPPGRSRQASARPGIPWVIAPSDRRVGTRVAGAPDRAAAPPAGHAPAELAALRRHGRAMIRPTACAPEVTRDPHRGCHARPARVPAVARSPLVDDAAPSRNRLPWKKADGAGWAGDVHERPR